MSEYKPTEVDRLAQIIRTADGNHDMGAGALAEAIADSGFLYEIRTDERAKRPDREQLEAAIKRGLQAYYDHKPTGGDDPTEPEHLIVEAVLSSLALEPEVREEGRPSRVLNEYDDSTTRGLRRGEEVLRQLEHHWAADSASQAIEELLRLRRIVEAREVSHD